jgi:hypothetical protein
MLVEAAGGELLAELDQAEAGVEVTGSLPRFIGTCLSVLLKRMVTKCQQ